MPPHRYSASVISSNDDKDIDWSNLRLQVMGHPSAKAAPATRGSVGYGKPSKSSQFQKGHSGDPNGRPVKVVPFGALVRDIADIAQRKIKANRGDGAQEISMQRAVLEKTMESALKGNAMAQREVLKQFQMAEAAEEAHRAQIAAEWRAYQGEGWRRIRKAQDARRRQA